MSAVVNLFFFLLPLLFFSFLDKEEKEKEEDEKSLGSDLLLISGFLMSKVAIGSFGPF